MPARLAIALVVVLATAAHAAPRVLLVETRDAPVLPTLASQVDMHAAGRATVQTRVARDEDPFVYAERASQLVARGGATIVIWIAPVEHGFLVFAAGRWPGRALIELVRVEATIAPAELERTIALKIAGLLDDLLAPRAAARVVLGIDPAEPSTRWRVEIGGLVVRDSHQRLSDGRTVLGISRASRAGGWTIAPTVLGYWQPSGTIDGATGRASVTELGAGLAIEGGRRLGRFAVFVRPRLLLAALIARGESNDGRRGTATVAVPYAGADAGLRLSLSSTAQVGLSAGSDLALVHHRLAIDEATVVDVGRARLDVGVSLLVSL